MEQLFVGCESTDSISPTALTRPSPSTSSPNNPYTSLLPPSFLLSPIDIGNFSSAILVETLFRPQLTAYFDRINPMMPVLVRHDLLTHLDKTDWLQHRDNLALVLVTTALALVHPLTREEKAQRSTREGQAMMLFDQACRLVAAWDYGCVSTVEKTLTAFVMFGILHELGQSWGARMRLRDAITMAEGMGLHRPGAYAGCHPWEARRRMRLLYILTLTERYIPRISFRTHADVSGHMLCSAP